MRAQFGILAAVAASAIQPLCAVDGTLLAQSGDSPAFIVYSAEGATYAAATQGEIDALPPVFRRMGETVTATSPSGSMLALASSSLSSILNAGGVWTLVGSKHGTALIGVAWNVHNDGGTLASSVVADAFSVDSRHSGPDRRVNLQNIMPVSYTGDNWNGDVSAASTLTFVSPDGIETTLNLTGTGATTEFKLCESGNWTVTLTMASGATHTAIIKVSAGFVLMFT